jgi:hypothetical protein
MVVTDPTRTAAERRAALARLDAQTERWNRTLPWIIGLTAPLLMAALILSVRAATVEPPCTVTVSERGTRWDGWHYGEDPWPPNCALEWDTARQGNVILSSDTQEADGD